MRRTLSVFQIPAGAAVPVPVGELELEAKSHDDLRATARALLAERYPRVKSVSFTPSGLVAYVEAEACS